MAGLFQETRHWYLVEDNQDKAIAFIEAIQKIHKEDEIFWLYTDPFSEAPEIVSDNLRIIQSNSLSNFLNETTILLQGAHGIMLLDIDAPLFENKTNPDSSTVQPLLEFARGFLSKSEKKRNNLIFLTTAIARVYSWKRALSKDYSRVKELELLYKLSTIHADALKTVDRADFEWNLLAEYGYNIHRFLEDMNKLTVGDCHNWSSERAVSDPHLWDPQWSMPLQLAHWIKFLKFRDHKQFLALFDLTVQRKAFIGQTLLRYKEDGRLSEAMKIVGTSDSPGICLLGILLITWAAFRKHYQNLSDSQLFVNTINNCDHKTIPRITLVVLNQSTPTLNKTIIALYEMMDKLLTPKEEGMNTLHNIGISKSSLTLTLKIPFEHLKTKMIEVQKNKIAQNKIHDSSGDSSQAILNFQNRVGIMDQNFHKTTILSGSNFPMKIIKSESNPQDVIKIIFGYERQD